MPSCGRRWSSSDALLANAHDRIRRRPVSATLEDTHRAARRLHRGSARGRRSSRDSASRPKCIASRSPRCPAASSCACSSRRCWPVAPDVLLLDEPTNHLDILSIRWLERFPSRVCRARSSSSRTIIAFSTTSAHTSSTSTTSRSRSITATTRSSCEAKTTERERREKDIAWQQKEIAHNMEFVERFRPRRPRRARRRASCKHDRSARPRRSRSCRPARAATRRSACRSSGTAGATCSSSRASARRTATSRCCTASISLVRRGDRLAIIGPERHRQIDAAQDRDGRDASPTPGTVEWGYETHPGYFAQDHHETSRNAGPYGRGVDLRTFCPDKGRRLRARRARPHAVLRRRCQEEAGRAVGW